MRPLNQIRTFLSWFHRQDVRSFDIHVRTPETGGEDYKKGNWIWLTHHEDVDYNNFIKLIPWIKHKNANRSDIYFRPHKDGVHKVIFLDDVPTAKAKTVLNKYGSCVTETHPGNTQIWLKTNESLDRDQRKQAQIILKDLGYSDPGSVAGSHLGRLCGVISQKHKCWVNLVGTSDNKPWSPNLETIQNLSPSRVFCASNKKSGRICVDTSDSGREWGWVLGMLRNGMDKSQVTEKLIEAAMARNKRNAVKYAHYTIRKAVSSIIRQ